MSKEILLFVIKEYEKKLRELMSEDQFAEFVTDVSKMAYKKEIDEMADSDFKEFCKANSDKIMGSNSDFLELLDDANRNGYGE